MSNNPMFGARKTYSGAEIAHLTSGFLEALFVRKKLDISYTNAQGQKTMMLPSEAADRLFGLTLIAYRAAFIFRQIPQIHNPLNGLSIEKPRKGLANGYLTDKIATFDGMVETAQITGLYPMLAALTVAVTACQYASPAGELDLTAPFLDNSPLAKLGITNDFLVDWRSVDLSQPFADLLSREGQKLSAGMSEEESWAMIRRDTTAIGKKILSPEDQARAAEIDRQNDLARANTPEQG